MVDMSAFVEPKSDQLNADDLIAGPRMIRIARVSGTGNSDQPVAVYFEGDGNKPFKPCKSMRRVMIAAWGADASKYVGRSMTLYRDPKVRFGGMEVGGIRISHMSHIERDMRMALTVTKAKREPYHVQVLTEPKPQQPSADPKPAAPSGWPVLAPDESLKEVPPDRWIAAVSKALRLLTSADAVRAWRQAMGPHIASIAEQDDLKAMEADRLIEERLADLAPPEREPGEEG